jgi:hypothetical protein
MPRAPSNPFKGPLQRQQLKNALRNRGATVLRKALEWSLFTQGYHFVLLDMKTRGDVHKPGLEIMNDVAISCSERPENFYKEFEERVLPAVYRIMYMSPRTHAETTKMIERIRSKTLQTLTNSHEELTNVTQAGVPAPAQDPAFNEPSFAECAKNLAAAVQAWCPGASETLQRCAQRYEQLPDVPRVAPEAEPQYTNMLHYFYPEIAKQTLLSKTEEVMTPFSVGTTILVEDDGDIVYTKANRKRPSDKTQRRDSGTGAESKRKRRRPRLVVKAAAAATAAPPGP